MKVNTNNDADHVNDEEDDSFSDLLGSDHDDESDEDDEIEVDSESEFDAIEKKKSRVVNKIDKKDAANGEVPAKGFNNKDIQITEKKTNKNVKRKSDEDISSASSKKTKKGVAVSKEEFTEAKKISKKIKGVK